jgi:hypothetical protein
MKYFIQEILILTLSNEDPLALYSIQSRRYKKYIPIASFTEWERIEINFDNGTRTVPSTRMLNELIMMPVIDRQSIYNILNN